MDRPCHYVRGPRGERVLVPGCIGGLHSNNLRDCCCDRVAHRKSLEDRIDALERAVRALTESKQPTRVGGTEA